MARIALTLRLDDRERDALENLSKVEGRPVNQLVNEAIKSYLSRRGQKERSLEANLAGLREYRKQDPGFRRAIDARSWKPKQASMTRSRVSRSTGSSSRGGLSRQDLFKARSESF